MSLSHTDRSSPIPIDPTTSRLLRGRDRDTTHHAGKDDTEALHDLAGRAVGYVRTLDVPEENAVIGIYRSLSRSSRIAARILRTLLSPMTCLELTPAFTHPATAGRAEGVSSAVSLGKLHLVIDLSRFGHPQARAIAEDLGVPLVVRPLPALPAWGSEPSEAVDRGTEAGRAIALHPGVRRPAAVRPLTRRGGRTGPVASSR